MARKPQNLGRAYLVAKLMERGCSRRQSVEILNMIFREMSKALKRDEKVQFPFGYLELVYTQMYWDMRRWGQQPRQPFTVIHELDEAGERLLNGREEV